MSSPVSGRWEHFAHGADIGVRGMGTTKQVAFAQAALALSAVITNPDLITPNDRVDIHCQAPDDELLLVDWLNAVVYEMATRKMLFGRFDVRIDDHRIAAVAWGEPVALIKHQPTVEVKGATYTSLLVQRGASGMWLAQWVVDV